MLRKFRWVNTVTLDAGSGTVVAHMLDPRNPLDPLNFHSTVTHEAHAMRELASNFDRWVVVGAKIHMRTTNSQTSAQSEVMFGVFLGNNDDYTNINGHNSTQLMEEHRFKNGVKLQQFGTNNKHSVATATYSMKKWHGIDFDNDSLYADVTGGVPIIPATTMYGSDHDDTRRPYFVAYVASPPGADAAAAIYTFDITYIVRLERRASEPGQTVYGA